MIETQGDAAKALIDEMNSKHNNALMIQEISSAILGRLSIEDIVTAALRIIKKRSDYDRGVIFQIDANTGRLNFISAFGYGDNQKRCFERLAAEFDKADSNTFFVKCFKDKKAFTYNARKKSKKYQRKDIPSFFRDMAAGSVICVPIVYEKRTIGLMILERTQQHYVSTNSDINLLLGISSNIASAMINAESFGQIKNN